VDVNSERWVTVADSPHDHEREALAWLRRRLPDREPFHVWTNFEFTAQSGKLYEVDALVVADTGLYLVEIKSHPGSMAGDGSRWTWTTPEGNQRTLDNPRLLANSKAKALKTLLDRSKTFRKNHRGVPYVNEAVFLSDPDLTVTLAPAGRHNVYGRDPEKGEETPRQRQGLTGIVDLLTDLDAERAGHPVRRIDRPTARDLAKAIEEIGIRERSSRRKVGDYVLGELLTDVDADRDTGVAYQDFEATHASIDGLVRRLRLYPLERNATTEQREAATRAAKREFEILHPLDHPGIARPVDYTEHERGPVLLFDHDPTSVPVDRWLVEHGEQLTVEDRLGLFRDIAEAVGYAHNEGIFHRALCPSAVLVGGELDQPRVQVTNWHTAARIATGTTHTTLSGTAHVDDLAAGDAALYRAPEASQPEARPATLDVFSLGCLAAFLLTGEHPAPTPTALLTQLTAGGAVTLEATGDAVADDLAGFVVEATNADAGARLATVADVLAYLDSLEEEWTTPEREDEPHILAAHRGQTLEQGRFKVLGRLGQGSSALALLARDTSLDRFVVLKVATEPATNALLQAEGEVLGQLHHPRIVQLLDGPLEIDGHVTLVLSYAGPEVDLDRDEPVRGPRTLADRIGDLGLEFTQRFGDDLLDALRHLEEVGVGHRDIKPANLGVTELGAKHELHLVLFDFSLARAPAERIDAGTAGYLDPFLKRRRRWDPAADRYSAAVVLYEMLTGRRPVYGDGSTDPALAQVPQPLRLDLVAHPPALTQFFTTALAADADDRFGTADDMFRAWRAAWDDADQPVDAASPFGVPSTTTPSTPLAGLGLSNRAVHALENVDVLTVGELLDLPTNRLRGLRGVGSKTRAELVAAVAALRSHLPGPTAGATSPTSGEAPTGETTVDSDDQAGAAGDRLADTARRLVPRSSRADGGTTERVLRRALGLDDPIDPWPNQSDLATEAHVSRQRTSQIMGKARARWAKQPAVTEVRDWVASSLDQFNDVATFDQLAQRLSVHRPDGTDPDLARHATAVLRAALLVEADRHEPRLLTRRMPASAVVTATRPDDVTFGPALADYVTALADATDTLVADRSLVSRADLVTALREVPVPAGARPLPDAHLAEVAAAASTGAAVTSRLELYRKGLPAAEALAEARRALVGLRNVGPSEIRRKVAARFPEAEPLPDRPELDELLRRAGLDLAWNAASGHYELPTPPTINPTATGTATRFGALVAVPLAPVELDAAADFDERLAASTHHGGLVVLLADRADLELAAAGLARHAVTTVDLDSWLLEAIRNRTAAGKPSWELVVDADAAGPGTPQWANFQKLLDPVLAELTERLAATDGAVLLVHLGLLARYDRLDVVATWRDRLQAGNDPLRALWLLTATTPGADVPFVDDRPVPVITANEHARIPTEWLRDVHRALATA
jgi:serine/threonine protein kinase